MGVHVGLPKLVRDPTTRRAEYIGPVVNTAARITAMTHGGQIVLSHTTYAKIIEHPLFSPGTPENKQRLLPLGKFEMPDCPTGADIYLYIYLYLSSELRRFS